MSGASVRVKDMCTIVEVPISMALNSQNHMHSVVDLHIAAILQVCCIYLERDSRARPTGVGETASDLMHSLICVLVYSWNPNPIKRTRLRYLRVYCHWRSPSLFRGLGLRQCTCNVTHFASVHITHSAETRRSSSP